MIIRTLEQTLKAGLGKGKATILLGPRQVGKSTLIRQVLNDRPFLFFNGDDPKDRSTLDGIDTAGLAALIGDASVVFIDEAQRITGIGLTLKLITDRFPDVKLIVSGSSALEMTSRTSESLTGRKREYRLLPISWEEYDSYAGVAEADRQLENRLIYGMYPEVVMDPRDQQAALRELVSSYLFRDVLQAGGIRKPEFLERLLRALALQLGNEVSYNELSGLLGIDKNTVLRYLDLLEKSFIIFQLPAFSRNIRNELRNSRKVYFHDNGIRNQLINNLNPLGLRADVGALWENFLVSERIKMQGYHGLSVSNHFWRNHQSQEIDFVEDSGGTIRAWEFKWNKASRFRFPTAFMEAYQATGIGVDRTNFRDFLKYGC